MTSAPESIRPAHTAIAVHEVVHTYAGARRESVRALDAVSFDVQAQTVTAIIGANGSGKSTLFSLITGMTAVQQGSVVVLGGAPRTAAGAMGVAFQSPALDPQLTVFENIACHAMLYGRRLRRTSLDADMLDTLELADLLDRKVQTLSGGFQRRVEMAKVLSTDPVLLVLDEPFNGLDHLARERWLAQLRRLQQSRALTVLVITHHLDIAERSDDVVLLERGQVLAQAAPAVLLAEFGSHVVDLDARDRDAIIERLRSRCGARAVLLGDTRALLPDLPIARLLEHVDMTRDGVTSVVTRTPTLGDVFVARTGRVFERDDMESLAA